MTGTGWPTSLAVSADATRDAAVLNAHGVLDGETYLPLRDMVIGAALEEPLAVVVDVTDLDVPADSAWLAFTSARRHVDRWPDVPITLVCEHTAGRDAIARSGVDRYVPVHPTVESAVDALQRTDPRWERHRALAELPADISSLSRGRRLVAGWLTAWSRSELITAAKVIATAFIENVLAHTDSAPRLRLESENGIVTVAVEDSSHRIPGLREGPATSAPTGLRTVSILCRMWGTAPTPSGKTVWAIIGPENQL